MILCKIVHGDGDNNRNYIGQQKLADAQPTETRTGGFGDDIIQGAYNFAGMAPPPATFTAYTGKIR